MGGRYWRIGTIGILLAVVVVVRRLGLGVSLPESYHFLKVERLLNGVFGSTVDSDLTCTR